MLKHLNMEVAEGSDKKKTPPLPLAWCTDTLKQWLYIYTVNLSSAASQKEDQKMVFKTNYRSMQVKSIAEC